ncbi:MAG: helix-turn-helix transcriptional regulator [Bacteroides sp.]|nr:helix-turn-helix transcriptional regulator [Bacteroides sp.]
MPKTINLTTEDIMTPCYHEMIGESYLDVSEHAIVYVARGSMEVLVDGVKKTMIKEKECVFVRKDYRTMLVQRPSDDVGYHLSIVLFFPRNILFDFYKTLREDDLPKKKMGKRQSITAIPASPKVSSLFDSFKPYYEARVRPDSDWLTIKVFEAVKLVLQNDENAYASLFDFTARWRIDIIDFMEKNYMYDLSIEQIAHYTGRSLASFKRDFKKISNLSPRTWLIRRRLHAAHYMLLSTEKNVKQVMAEVGFKNFSHFSKAYREHFGFTPTETRIQNRDAEVIRKSLI